MPLDPPTAMVRTLKPPAPNPPGLARIYPVAAFAVVLISSAPLGEKPMSQGAARGAPTAGMVPGSAAVLQVAAARPAARETTLPLVFSARTVQVEASTKNREPVPGCKASAVGVRAALSHGSQGAPTPAPTTVAGAPVPATTLSVPWEVERARITFSAGSAR